MSRVGSQAQTKAMKKVSGRIKLDLAQFRDLEAFMQFAQDLDPDTKKRIDTGRRLVAVLNQYKNAPMSFHKQALVMFAATNGYLDSVEPENISAAEEKMLAFMDREGKDVLEAILKEKAISDETEKSLRAKLETFQKTVLGA